MYKQASTVYNTKQFQIEFHVIMENRLEPFLTYQSLLRNKFRYSTSVIHIKNLS